MDEMQSGTAIAIFDIAVLLESIGEPCRDGGISHVVESRLPEAAKYDDGV
jgi:hypothetical protein